MLAQMPQHVRARAVSAIRRRLSSKCGFNVMLTTFMLSSEQPFTPQKATKLYICADVRAHVRARGSGGRTACAQYSTSTRQKTHLIQ